MSTILFALGIVGFIAIIVGMLMLVHKRDQKREAIKNAKPL